MNCYLKSIDYDLWYMHDDIIPMKKFDDRLAQKTQEDFDEKDKIMISMNSKAKNDLMCRLDRNIYNSIDHASRAHEM